MADELSKKSAEIKTSVSSKTEVAEGAAIPESDEASEFVDKLPSEKGEKSAEDTAVSAGGGNKQAKDDKAAAILAELEPKELPPRNVMKRQVQDVLVGQESLLRKEARKYERQGNPYKLNIALQKIREIRLILADLAKATYEILKNLWFKYVHNEKRV
jgi:hypothetical protein